MPGNTFGKLFKVTTWGESHGKALGAVIDGCPPGLLLNEQDIQKELDKRKPGKGNLISKRKEKDKVEILSGVFEGKTLGTPISMIVRNHDANSKDYKDLRNIFRPGHADFTYYLKYGLWDFRGGGRASGRETVARVMAGAVAKKILSKHTTIIKSKVINIAYPEAYKEGDSSGGTIEIIVKNPPKGLGEPVFDKLNADLAMAVFSIGGIKGLEFGLGFKSAELKGSENNDVFNKTNNAGGILGGISNGEDITIKIAVKPPSSISKEQTALTKNLKKVKIKIEGRHDSCLIPRILPVIESMIAITLVDHLLRRNAIKL
ncbi:chorismate synthase [Candidatus Peregrinibacteria bacterium]|nr:chorismate synthase [Candidatus Peregrinibacteria bacterium]